MENPQARNPGRKLENGSISLCSPKCAALIAAEEDLKHAADNDFKYLQDADGKWVERQDVWYYEKDGEAIGPFQKRLIKSFIKSGVITEDTPVWPK